MTSRYERYRQLNAQLKTLNTVEFAPSDWHLLERGAKDGGDSAYKKALPFIFAEFRESAVDAFMEVAYRQNSLIHKPPLPILNDCREDILRLDRFFLGSHLHNFGYLNSLIGPFRDAHEPHIHGDKMGQNVRMYISRLGALPLQFIRMSEVEALPPGERTHVESLISDARMIKPGSSFGRAQKQELIERNVLQDLPLGALAIMRGGVTGSDDEGTWHCSSDFPMTDGAKQPIFSVALRADMYSMKN